ncbi:GPI mannosyltransferase 2 [Trametes punicea]|nr:GPI mannosyltransferase 2 [Trametes punicea]
MSSRRIHTYRMQVCQPRDHRRFLIVLTTATTLLTLLLTVTSSQLPLFDSSPNALLPSSSAFSLRRMFASALLRWDAFHFAHIAREGYVYEHEWAFFPGVPCVMQAWAVLTQLVQPPMQPSESALREWEDILLGGLIASLLSIPSVLALYDLTLVQFSSPAIALLASLLSLLPSSPVTLRIAGYSEPFFSCLSYVGMLCCARKQWLLATCCFALATIFRSNAIFLAGFIAWGLVVEPLLSRQKVPLRRVLYASALCSLACAFFVYHQYHAYRIFCTGTAARARWCDAVPPSIYTYVQAKYWNVGFLRYWTLQQLPNFLLGAPPLLLLFTFTLRYVRLALIPRLITLALGPTSVSGPPNHNGAQPPFLSPSIAPHVIHALIHALLLLFASHTQIVLRLAASMPLTYWAAAWLLVEWPALGKLWVDWSVIWGAVSCVLWGVFLPPA